MRECRKNMIEAVGLYENVSGIQWRVPDCFRMLDEYDEGVRRVRLTVLEYMRVLDQCDEGCRSVCECWRNTMANAKVYSTL